MVMGCTGCQVWNCPYQEQHSGVVSYLVVASVSFLHTVLLIYQWYERTGIWIMPKSMMTSSNGNIFRVTDPLCGKFTGPGEIPAQRPVTRSFAVFFYLRPNKRLSNQPWGWWFETPSWSLWRQCNGYLQRCVPWYLFMYFAITFWTITRTRFFSV